MRRRAQRLYVARTSLAEIVRRTGVAKATIQRWAAAGSWDQLRDAQQLVLERSSAATLQLMRLAAETGDPQTTYAAATAARLAGLDVPDTDPHPAPERVIRAVLTVLTRDDELGPIIRRRRAELVDLVLAEVPRLGVDVG